jgi:DNA-binding CsgD family transcriptional regulator
MARHEGRGTVRAPTGGEHPAVVARASAVPLVGRARQLEELEQQVLRAMTGEFRVALVTGAAGLGKTRLVSEVLSRHGGDAQCLSARSYRWGSTASFGPWAEALDRTLRGRDEAAIRKICGNSLTDLAALLGTARAVAGPSVQTPSRERLLEGLVTIFDRLSSRGPVLVALDDAHLADSSSWEALRFLGRRLEHCPIVVLLTARPLSLDQRPIAVEVLVGLEEDGLLIRQRLEPLGRAEVTELAHGLLRAEHDTASSFVPEPLVSWLMDRSLGQPLFVIGLLRALVEERADLNAPRLERLSSSLRERVSLEVGELDTQDRELLELLAVADRRTELHDLLTVAGQEPEQVGASLEVLTRARLVIEQESDGALSYGIAHPIVQEAIYESIGGARRRGLHRTVAAALLDVGHLGAAAAHLARGAEPGDVDAVDGLCRAMAQAESRGLHREALATLDALVDVLPDGDERWQRVLQEMDWQPEWVLSHLAEADAPTAITAMRRIEAQLSDSDDLAGLATVQFHLAAFLSFGAGRLAEAEAACRTAAELFAAAGVPERALLARNELAWLRGCAGDLTQQAEQAGAVVAEATRAARGGAAVQATATQAYALGFLGRFAEAAELFERTVELARQEGNSYRVAWARSQHGCVLGLAGRLPEAIESVRSALAEDDGAPDALAYENLGHGHWLAGRLSEALDSLHTAVVRRPVQGSRRRAWGTALAARLHAEMGRLERARPLLRSVTETYGGQPFLVWGFWEPWTTARLLWQEQGPGAAVIPYAAVADQLRDLSAVPYELLALTELSEIAAEAHATDRAEQVAARLQQLTARHDGEALLALATLGLAWCLVALGEHDRAATAADEAARGLAASGHRLHHGSALHAAGRANERGDRAAAVAALQRAAEVFDDCEAVWRRHRVVSDLNRLGSRGRRAAAVVSGPASLTGREREVATLAVRGYSAAEVAAQLFIGRRTVESHLANCYAKLGVRTKRELIRRAPEFGLAPAVAPLDGLEDQQPGR